MTKEEVKSPLLNKRITISLIRRLQSSLYSDEDLSTLATGGAKSFTCPIDRQTGTLIDPLTRNERTWLEEELGVDLSVHKTKENFWSTKKAKGILRKTGKKTSSADLELNLLNPYHFILYKVALINSRVANTWSDRFEGKEKEFVIIDGDVELKEELGYNKKESKVQRYLLDNESSKKKLFDLLRMYGGRAVNFSNSTEFMHNELKKAARRKSQVEKLHNLIILGEKEIADKIFLADCVSIGLLNKYGYEYTLVGGDKIANNEIEAITWFSDRRNSSTRIRFEQAIDDFFEDKKVSKSKSKTK